MISSEVSPLFVDLSTNWRLLVFAAAMALVTCVLFGLAPALRATWISLADSMKTAGRGVACSRERFGLRRALVVTQVALSLMLLVAGLLFVRSLYNLLTLDAGFHQAEILEVDTDLTRLKLPVESRHAIHQALIEQIREIPGVSSVSSASTIPLVGRWNETVYFGGSDEERKGLCSFNRVSSHYFRTMETPLLAGRDFDDRDKVTSPKVAIVNEMFALRFLNGATPLGTTFRLEGPSGKPERSFQIVGLVRDTKYGSLREEFKPIVYLAASQNERPSPYDQILIRSRLPLTPLMSAVKGTLEGTNPGISFHFHNFQEQIRYSILQERLMAMLAGFFAFLASILATVGLYGVISYSVTQRTNEIGIRLALGADQRSIVRLILREAATLLAIGLAAGAVLSLVSANAARTLLFGLQPNDPVTLVAAIVLLASVAAAASYLPARRASKSDPMVALRYE